MVPITTACASSDDFETDTGGKLVIRKGCGIKGTPDGIAANVSTWTDTDCTVDQGGGIYCDPATGLLHTDPRHHYGEVFAEETEDNDANLPPDSTRRTPVTRITLDLTDHCKPVVAHINARAFLSLQFNGTPGSDTSYRAFVERTIDGGSTATLNYLRDDVIIPNGGSKSFQDRRNVFSTPITLAPGVIHTIDYRLGLENLEATGGSNIRVFQLTMVAEGTYGTVNP